LLKGLTNLGYLQYDQATRCYVPTLRIALLGSWIQDGFFRRDNLLDLMQTLGQKVKGSAIVGLQNGIFAQYIMMLDARGPAPILLPTGSLRPLCRSAIGRMLLTTKRDGDIIGILRRSNAQETQSQNRMSQRALLAEVELCRQRGYAFTEGTVTPGHGVIAVLLPRTAGHAPMAMGIGGTTAQLRKSRERILDLLRRQISIKYRDPTPLD
jgi:DNA-binding IclR family transcriptional regulator